jgi:hypothetical protein
MITCKRASELISRSIDEELSMMEKISLCVHLFICNFCRQFSKQLKLIRHACRGHPEKFFDNQKLSQEAKQRIIDKIKAEDP